MRALIDAADSEQYGCLIEFLLHTGVRVGEAAGLTLADLDPGNNVVHVRFQLGRDGRRVEPKTQEAQRGIDISDTLMRRMLRLLNERGTRFDPTAFVFASRNGTGLERKTIRAAVDRAVKAAGLSAPKPTLHDLRHSHASMLIFAGVSVVEVQQRLGHRSPTTTLHRYVHEWKL